MLPVIVLGGGGHAKAVIALAQRAGHTVLGVIDPDPAALGNTVLGVPVLGNDDVVRTYRTDAILLANGIGYLDVRARLFQSFRAAGYRFATLVDPAAVVIESAVLGEGVQVLASAVVQADATVGDNTIVNTGSIVEHCCCIGEGVHVAPGAVLAGGVTVGAWTMIGAGSSVRQGLRIGSGAVVGLGAAVVSDVPDGAVVIGVPARRKLT